MIEPLINLAKRVFIPSRKHVGLIIPLALAAIYVFPFRFNGLLDMPNHMARAFIMKTCLWDSSNPLCSHYIVSFEPSTFFLSDLTLIGYLLLFPPFLAEKCALFLVLASFTISWYILYRRINGSINIGYVAGLSLILNNYMYSGFYAYILSVTAALFWFYYWWDLKDKKTVLNQMILSFAMALIFGIHLAGFLFIFIIYVFYEIQKRYSEYSISGKSIFTDLYRILPLMATFLGLLLTQRMIEKGNSMAVKTYTTDYRTVVNKIAALAYPFVNYSRLDLLVILTVLIVLICAVDLSSFRKLLRCFWAKVSVLFFILFIITPSVMNGVYDFDVRFLLIAYLALFIAVGSFLKKEHIYSAILCIALLLSFGTSLYYKNMTSQELTKIYNIMNYCPGNSSLVEISSIRNYPYNSKSRVSPIPYFSQYHAFEDCALVGGLFNCKSNKNISYFCYADDGIISPDNFHGISAVDRSDIVKLAHYYDYILLIANENENENYIRSKLGDDIFTLVQKNDSIYLFRNNRKI